MYFSAARIICIAAVAAIELAQAQTNIFVNPPPATNPANVAGSFIVGSSLKIVWRTKGNILDLLIVQILPDGNSSSIQYLPNSRGLQSTTDYLWKVDFSGTGGNPKFDLDFSPTFYFGLVEAGATVISTLSQEVNFTNNVLLSSSSNPTILSSPTSSLASPSTPSLTTGSSLPVAVTSTVALPSPSSTSSESSEGLSSSAKIGVGVGVGVGVLALAAGFGLGYWFFGRRKATKQQAYPEQTYVDNPPMMAQNDQWKSEMASPVPKQFERSELQ